MRPTKNQKRSSSFCYRHALGLLLFLLTISAHQALNAATLDARYPGLVTGLLKSAELAPLKKDTLLIADGVTIKRSRLLEGIKDQEPKLRAQLEKNLLFVLQREATRQILLNEALNARIAKAGEDESLTIQALFEQETKAVKVTLEEARTFYETNKEMVGGVPFEDVKNRLLPYLLNDKKQQVFENYVTSLGERIPLRLNQNWVATQSRLALDNPVDKARNSGKVTMVEFGATGCVPCDMMQPILDKLRKDFPEKLNVVFVHVREEQILASRYGIRSIPVQVFYDAKGKEAFRHVGFFAQTEVNKQLAKMGVQK